MEEPSSAAPDPTPGTPFQPGASGPTPPPPTGQGPAPVIPWEDPALPVFTAFGRTVGMLASSPRRAFESMPLSPAFGRPLAFAVIVGWIGVIAGTFWELVLGDWLRQMLPFAGEQRWGAVSSVARVVAAMAAPIWLPIVLLIGTLIQHVFLFLVGGARRGFIATFRVGCYAWVTMMLAIVPMGGQLIGAVWGVVLTIIGLSAAHQIGTGKATLAVLLPVLLCCGCAFLCIALFGAAILGTMGAGR